MGLQNSTFRLFDAWMKALPKPPEVVLSLGVPDMPIKCEVYFANMGVKRFIAVDANAFEGAEYVFDLNTPLPTDHNLYGVADLVIDPGTCEHVFDIAEALRNVTRMCKPTASVFHHAPINWMNHGFHNPSPCCYYEWYLTNGWSVNQWLRKGDVCEPYSYSPKVTTIPEGGGRWLLNTIATRTSKKPTTMNSPQQARYSKGEWL